MAVTLKFISRAPCKQHLLAASPKVLGSVTPKTTARSPLAASGSPFFGTLDRTPLRTPEETSAASFGTPSASSSALRRTVEASAASQQDLAASVRPSAESARQHFLGRQAQRSLEAAFAESQGSLLGSRLPTLLQHGQDAPTTGATGGGAAEERDPIPSARAYAERAREHFLARQQAQHLGAGIPERVGMPTLLTPRQAAGAMSSPELPVLLGSTTAAAEVPAAAGPLDTATQGDDARALAEMARQSFLARQRSISGRAAALQVP